MKIKLTEGQIKELIGAKEQQIKLHYAREVDKLNASEKKEIESLKKKYEHFEINLEAEEVPKAKRTPINEDELKKLVTAGKTKSEIAKQMGKTYASIDQKVKKLGLKVKTKGK